MSCSSKRSLIPTMSRSSTITDNTQGICFGSASYKGSSMDTHQRMHIATSKPTAMDRISMRSQESCGNISEFSMSRQYHQNPHHHSLDTTSHRSFSVPRSHEPTRNFVGSYENYDSPKILSPSNENQMENYDKPRSVKMYLEQNVGGKLTVFNGEYGNYDTPNIPKNVVCGCMGNNSVQSRILTDDMGKQQDCTCHRVMSWADNWMPCRRGSGIENTGIPISRLVSPPSQNRNFNTSSAIAQDPAKCKLNDFSTPDTDKSSLYALVDPSKKQTKRLIEEQSKPIQIPRATTQTPCANYANLEFEKSLEIYENAKEVLKRENVLSKQSSREEANKENSSILIPSGEKTNENYLVMEIHEKTTKTFPGYISMHPAQKTNEPKRDSTLPSTHKAKKLLLRLEEKSFSNPDLNRPCLDYRNSSLANSTNSTNDRKLLFKKSSSVDSFRYIESEETSSTIIEDEPQSTASTDTYQDVKTVEALSSHSVPVEQQPVKPHEHIKVVNVRHSESPSKQPNRDSSSSNDSGVSTASAVPKEYNEFELPLINQIKKRRQLNQNKPCVHSSLIRRSKSFDPFGDLSFQFNQNRKNANGNGPIQNKSGKCPSLGAIMTAVHIDSNSTSSGTSDMSDYIETLSLSSHSSSDIEALRYSLRNLIK
jgi:hypothetical protein